MRKLLILSLLLLPLVLQGETPKLPKDKELKALVSATLSAFNKAVQEKNFARFHEEWLSPQLQKEFTLVKFTAAFQVFIDKGYDLSNIAQSEPVFDVPPAIDSDGLLVLQGHYPTKPNKVTFKLTYVYESSAWKLMGINVQAIPENAGKVPTSRELKKLTLDSLLLFNEAIQTETFEDFYSHIAKLWQKQITSEKLLETFQPFIDQRIDIASIAKQEPAFEGTPAINEDGLLVLNGSYPTQPKVSFELKYVYEDDGWKLFGINVEVKPSENKAGKKAKEKKEKSEDDDNE
jgi:hypothetical protein